MSEIYYPYVPWSDDPIRADSIVHPAIHKDSSLTREGIFGPLAQVITYLKADVRYLKAIDGKKLTVLQDVFA